MRVYLCFLTSATRVRIAAVFTKHNIIHSAFDQITQIGKFLKKRKEHYTVAAMFWAQQQRFKIIQCTCVENSKLGVLLDQMIKKNL